MAASLKSEVLKRKARDAFTVFEHKEGSRLVHEKCASYLSMLVKINPITHVYEFSIVQGATYGHQVHWNQSLGATDSPSVRHGAMYTRMYSTQNYLF